MARTLLPMYCKSMCLIDFLGWRMQPSVWIQLSYTDGGATLLLCQILMSTMHGQTEPKRDVC